MAVSGAEIFDLGIQLVVGALYALVAYSIITRDVSPRAQLPNRGFALWWGGLAFLTIFGVLWTIIHWFIEPTIAAYVTYVNFLILIIMAAFAGMLYYFLYLYYGRVNLWVPISGFYLLMYVLFMYYIMLQEPSGFDADGTIVYANDLTNSAWGTAISTLWLLPPIIGAGMYLSLIRKAPDPILRFRIIIVATSIIVWFLISLGSSLSNVATDYSWWTYVSRAISVVVALLTLMAYRPPVWAKKRFKLEQ